ncbi:hypothetical protein NQZ68_031858 [Dissostichus eleginoides]|nr:hypothetical protein NQZ68_031858 [Dissostichus eleginoides]
MEDTPRSCDGGGSEEANQHDWGHLAGAEVLLKPSCPESHGLRDSLQARCRKTLAGILSPRPSSHILEERDAWETTMNQDRMRWRDTEMWVDVGEKTMVTTLEAPQP